LTHLAASVFGGDRPSAAFASSGQYNYNHFERKLKLHSGRDGKAGAYVGKREK